MPVTLEKDLNKKILMVMGPFSGKAWGAGQQDTYNLVKLIMELGHGVYLVTYDYNTNHEFVNKFKEIGAQVFVIPLNSKTPILKTALTVKNLALLFDPAMHPFFRLCANEDFKNLFERIQPEIVMGIQTFTFPVLDFAKKAGIPAILRSHALEYNYYLDMITSKHFFNPLTYLKYAAKYFLEMSAAKTASCVLAITPQELAVYKNWNSNSKLLPLCSLYEKIKDPTERLRIVHGQINLFYAGATYNILPHLKGAELLVEKIMPGLKSRGYDGFKLHIIGSKLPQRLIDKCDGKTIIYRGYVENYNATLEEMDIGVFPTFTGRGMKQKIFEAICKGFPVIAPEKVLGEYPLKHHENILLANNCDEFVENIIRLENKKERERISHNAYEFAKKHFNKDSYIKILKDSIREILV
jgi:glycosyltransferase involved in cell wall biosynthesis